ncbi:MAG: hypothetical protein KDE26_14295 [Bacteroidetes bacterium]|nr:hypothetical protein [Bacteroidota bacterium]MCB9343415.1 hypothetical protein [Lewinellaceae bacterium]
MNTKKITLLLLGIIIGYVGLAQERTDYLQNYWQVGFGLGELPTGGSFKPSITVGYHFNEKVYAGIIYQLKDEISRGNSSFNAQSTDLEGLTSSSEGVDQRFIFQVRYTPIKNGPYLSGGFVFNGMDTETMIFEDMDREIADEPVSGTIEIKQTRPAGWGLALGIGYQYNFKNGFSAGFEWTPAWGQYPTPSYEFGGTSNLSDTSQNSLKQKMDEGFKSSVTNMYKVFHIGVAYRFQ